MKVSSKIRLVLQLQFLVLFDQAIVPVPKVAPLGEFVWGRLEAKWAEITRWDLSCMASEPLNKLHECGLGTVYTRGIALNRKTYQTN